jgi:DNA-binding NarL/FixJ family response regulator
VTRAARQPDPSAWGQSASLWAAHNNRYRVAYARFRHAEALVLARAPRAEAQSELAAAAALSDELGAETLTAEIRALRRRARLGTATPVTPAVEVKVTPAAAEAEVNPYGLTERELEVLRLLAAGMTNREISQELFISQHTAGVHVSHILGKLGVANRVMAAGVAERLGLAPRA